MFDIGFSELLVCAIVALLVLGPERLPGAVRTVGRWVGRARHTVNQFTDQIDREMRAEEIRKRIEAEMKKVGVDDVTRQVNEALHAPLPPPLIGADHLRQAPPAEEDHPDIAPALAPPRNETKGDAAAPTATGTSAPASTPVAASTAAPAVTPVTAPLPSATPSPVPAPTDRPA